MSEKVNAIIVEDEKRASEALEDLIHLVSSRINIIDTAENVADAIISIQKHKPALIFLDIQLGEERSFKILEKLPALSAEIIFVTAYNAYAMEAFQFSAVDYLLKPINPERLSRAIEKGLDRLDKGQKTANWEVLLENLGAIDKKPKKIVLSTMDYVHVVDIQTIVRCQSSVNYTVFHLSGGKEIVVSRTLKEYDEQLSPYGFFRVHKSWLVNMQFVVGYNRKEGGGAILEGGAEVPVALSKKEEFLNALKRFF